MDRPQIPTLILVGGGGHAAVIADAVLDAGNLSIRGVLDDNPTPLTDTLGSLGKIDALPRFGECRWILAIGDLAHRRQWIEMVGCNPDHRAETVIHTGSIVSLTASVDAGVFIAAGAIVQARARIRSHAIINTGAIIEHDCEIGENSHLAPGAVLGGGVSVGHDTLIGLGARVKPGVHIGSGVTVGVGAVVIDDIEDGQTVVGVPARPMKKMVSA